MPYRGEAHAGALVEFLRREERLEDSVARRLVHAGAGVGHAQAHVVAVARVGVVQCGVLAEGHVRRADRDRAAVGHRVSAVQREIHEHLLDTGRVGKNRSELRREFRHEIDPFPEHPVEHPAELLDEVVELDHLRTHHVSAAEGEQLPREIRGALGRGADLRE